METSRCIVLHSLLSIIIRSNQPSSVIWHICCVQAVHPWKGALTSQKINLSDLKITALTFAAPRVGDLKYALEFGKPSFMQLEGIEWKSGSFVASVLKGFDELFIQVMSLHDLELSVSTCTQDDALR